jgi:hypothetical protein
MIKNTINNLIERKQAFFKFMEFYVFSLEQLYVA